MHTNVALIVAALLKKDFMESEKTKVVYQQQYQAAFVLSNEALSC